MNAQPQFIRNTFQAYYTVIPTSFSLLEMATQPILVPGTSKGGEDVRLCDLRLRAATPERTWALLLCCISCVLCVASFGLVIFIHLKSQQPRACPRASAHV